MKQDSKLWDSIIIDNAKYRAVELIQLLEFTKNECIEIAKNPDTRTNDKIEALTTACVAQANIVKIINQGPTFRMNLPVSKNHNNHNHQQVLSDDNNQLSM